MQNLNRLIKKSYRNVDNKKVKKNHQKNKERILTLFIINYKLKNL